MTTALTCQLILLVYHQVTTFFDLHPFNGARNYSRRERLTEMGVNAVLMSLAPVGYAFQIHALMLYGAVYYVVLFAMELIIWWVPYLAVPSGHWRHAYNGLLALATSDFQSGDTLERWRAIHTRIHSGTLTIIPERTGRIVPNL